MIVNAEECKHQIYYFCERALCFCGEGFKECEYFESEEE